MKAQDPNGIWTYELHTLECPDATEAEWAEATIEAYEAEREGA